MRLILVRHGETSWNVQKITQGIQNTQLSANGMRQGECLAKRFENTRVDSILTSPLARAVQTAKYIGDARKIIPEQNENLIEMNFGQWEGLTFDQIGQKFTHSLDVWNESPQKCVPNEMSETISKVEARVDDFIKMCKSKYVDKIVIAVTHTVPAKLIVARSIGLCTNNIHSLRMDNASVTVINYYCDRTVMRAFNDVAHLQCLLLNNTQKS